MVTAVVLLAVLAVIGVVVVWNVAGDTIADRASQLITRSVFGKDTRLVVESVGGFPLSNLTLTGVRVERRGPEGWFPFASARRVSARYDFWGLIHGRYALSNLDVEDLRLRLETGPEGGFLLPGTRGGGGRASAGHGPGFRIDGLSVRGGGLLIDLPWRTVTADSLRAEGTLEAGGDGLAIGIKRFSASLGDTLGDLSLSGGKVLTDSVLTLRKLEGTWAGTRFRVDGVPVGPVRDVRMAVDDLPLARLGRFLDQPALDRGHVDHLDGRVYTGPDSALAFRFRLAGTWDAWTVTAASGTGTLTDEVLHLQEVAGNVNGTTVGSAVLTLPLDGDGLSVSGRFADLDLQTLPVEAMPDLAGVLNGEADVYLDHRDDPQAGLRAVVDLGRGHVMEIPFKSARFRVEGTGGGWQVDTARVELEAAHLAGHGTVGPETLDLAFGYRGDLKPWRRFLKQESLSGDGNLDVRLTGPRTRPRLEAGGAVTRLEVATITAPRVELLRAEGVVTNGRDLKVEFAAPAGLAVSGTPFSRAEGRLTVGQEAVVMDSLSLVRGDTTVTVTGKLRWQPEIEIDVASARASIDGRRFWVDQNAVLTYSDDVLRTPGILIHTPRGSVRATGSVDTKRKSVDARFSLEDLDPSVFFPPDEPPSVRVGSMSGSLQVKGAVPELNGSADLGLKAVEWKDGRLDSLSFAVDVQGSTVTVTRAVAHRGDGEIRISGTAGLPQPIYPTLEAVTTGPEPDPARFTFDLTGDFDDVKLVEWLSFIRRPDRPVGRVDARIHLEGNAAAPRIRVEGEVGSLVWRRLEADTLVVRAGFAEGTVTVDSLATWKEGRGVDVSGTVPLDLTLYPFSWELPDRAMNLTVDARNGDLENLKLTPWVQDASGKLIARVRIYGTPRSPLVKGEVRVAGGTIRPVDRDEVLKDVTARITFDKDLVTIEEARADLGGGKVTASGTYRLHTTEVESYSLEIDFNRAVVRQDGTYAARISGKLTLKPTRGSDGLVYPYATGDVQVERAEYAGSLRAQDIGQFKPQPILYDVHVTAPSKIIVSTEDVNAELGGEVTVRQGAESRSILGELDILHGTYTLFLEEFRITTGKLTWNDPSSVIPQLDVTAQTTASGYLITVELTGPADKPVIQFSAQTLEGRVDAGLTQSEIIQLLAVGTVGLSPEALGIKPAPGEQNGQPGVEQKALGVGTQLIASELERRLARELGIVDEVTINPGFSQGQQASVGVRKWITAELSVAYSQGLSRGFNQDIAVEYRLGRSLFLRGEVIRRESTQFSPQTSQYNLDLKIRHEY